MVDRVLELEEEARHKHKLHPSIHRLNAVVLAYVKNKDPQKAEMYVREMR